MERWRSLLALTVAGALLASPVFAQTSGGGSTTPQTGSEQSKPSDEKKPDAAKPSDSSSPAASPQTGGTDATKSDATKSDAAKSDTMKSDKMKSGAGKADQAAGGNRQQVRAAQQALKDKAHDPGAIDGIMGPRTQTALKEFQKAQGLKETGRLDAETMAKLGVEAAASPAASPRTGASQPSGPDSSAAKAPSASPSGASESKSSADPTTPTKKPQSK